MAKRTKIYNLLQEQSTSLESFHHVKYKKIHTKYHEPSQSLQSKLNIKLWKVLSNLILVQS